MTRSKLEVKVLTLAAAVLMATSVGALCQTVGSDPSAAISDLSTQATSALEAECPNGDANIDSCVYRPSLRLVCITLADAAASDQYQIQLGRMSYDEFEQNAENETGTQASTDLNAAAILKAAGPNYDPVALLHAVYSVCMTNFKD